MKKYFIIRLLILVMYVSALIYGFIIKTNTGYIIAAAAVILGVVLNIINYNVNYKPILEEQNKKATKD